MSLIHESCDRTRKTSETVRGNHCPTSDRASEKSSLFCAGRGRIRGDCHIKRCCRGALELYNVLNSTGMLRRVKKTRRG